MRRDKKLKDTTTIMCFWMLLGSILCSVVQIMGDVIMHKYHPGQDGNDFLYISAAFVVIAFVILAFHNAIRLIIWVDNGYN